MGKYPYSFGEAVIYSGVLLITLWWIPVLGPIIIGYITGRKSGGPLKGLFAMAIPILLYTLFINSIHCGALNIPPSIMSYIQGNSIPNLLGISSLPFMNYINTTINLASNVGIQIESHLYYVPSSFFIMLAFAFIGGAVSRQVILERGLYKETMEEKEVKKRAPKPYNPNPPEESNEDDEPKRAPIPQAQYPQQIYAQPQPYPQPVYVQQVPQYPTYPQYPQAQYNPYQAPPQAPPMQQIPQGYYAQSMPREVEKQNKAVHATPQKSKRKSKRKKIKEFKEEDSKFVVHPMDTKKEIAINKKRINNENSIAFL